jgi:hypothetical protein
VEHLDDRLAPEQRLLAAIHRPVQMKQLKFQRSLMQYFSTVVIRN